MIFLYIYVIFFGHIHHHPITLFCSTSAAPFSSSQLYPPLPLDAIAALVPRVFCLFGFIWFGVRVAYKNMKGIYRSIGKKKKSVSPHPIPSNY